MCAESAVRIDIPSSPPDVDLGGSGMSAAPEVMDAEKSSSSNREDDQAAPDAEERRIPNAEELESRVVDLRKYQKAWKDRVKELEGQGVLLSAHQAELNAKKAHLAHLEKLDKHFETTRELGKIVDDLESMEREDTRDKKSIERLEEKREEWQKKMNEVLKRRKEKQEDLDALKQVVSPSSALTVRFATAGSAGGDDASKDAKTGVETLKAEIEALNREIDGHRSERDNCVDGLGIIKERRKKRGGQMEALKARQHEISAEVLVGSTEVAALAGIVGVMTIAHEKESEKEAVAREVKEGEEAVYQREMERLDKIIQTKTRPPLKEQMKRVAVGAVRVAPKALVTGAGIGAGIGAFGFFGGFHMVGQFFKTWARRIAHPHQFVDALFKKFESETAPPPKGKGFILGSIGAAFWTVAGDAPLLPHDTVHGQWSDKM